MANADHLRILATGPEAWKSWRGKRAINPDLSGADLNGGNLAECDFSGADFRRANVSRANLRNANLTGADLSDANLTRATLIDAKLSNANFSRADLSRADLDAANLSGATLFAANLSEATLDDANLSDASLIDAYLHKACFSRVNLTAAKLSGANLMEANLVKADLARADLRDANLTRTDLTGADLQGTNLRDANLREAHLIEANLSGANLSGAALVRTVLTNADLTGCFVYGLSVWDVQLEGTIQSNLVITPPDAPIITVDNLEIAQFIYLLLNNSRIRHVIDTITSKVVLILGRFTPERKVILDAIRDELRRRDYLPVLFDFEKPANRDISETVSTLAHMARFVIADLSDPKSIPHELEHVIPLLPSVPIMPLIVRPEKEYAMFEHFFGFRHVLKPFHYRDEAHLLSALQAKVIAPAEKLAQKVAGKRR